MLSQRTRFNSFRLVPWITITVMTACGPTMQSPKDQALQQQEIDAKKSTILGPLDQLNRTIINEAAKDTQFRYGKCDQDSTEIRKKLITAIEGQYGKTHESSDSSAAKESKTQKGTPIEFAGGILMKIDRKESDEKGWQTRAFGWKTLDRFYEKKKDQISFSSVWTKLLEGVRTLLDLDVNRITQRWKSGKNYGISKDNVKAIEGLYQPLAACAKVDHCYAPIWSNEQQTALNTIPIYQSFAEKISAATEYDLKRKVIKRFAAIMNDDIEQHSFHLNPSVTLTQGQKTLYHLPLDAHQLTDAEREFLKKSIEEIWTSDHAQVKVEWKLASENPEIFEVLFHNENGARANTTHGILKRVNLYHGTSNRAIAHEIGHVLGFQEHYYEVWNSEHCTYETQFNNEDLMSNQISGEVTAEEWAELKERYSPTSQSQVD